MEQRNEMFDAGMDDFLSKPYRFDEIHECLTKQLSVQYIYADTYETGKASDEILMPEVILTVLPQGLCQGLHDALESLAGERISAIIGQVESYDAKLYQTRFHLEGNLDYPAILKILQTNQPVNIT